MADALRPFDPPSTDAYTRAFRSLSDNSRDQLRDLLAAQYGFDDYTASAEEIAQAMGYENRGAANLHYGRLGKEVAAALGLKVEGASKGWPVLSEGIETPGGFLWRMHAPVARAMEAEGWAEPPPVYLLTWNPDEWTWDELPRALTALAEGVSLPQRWSTGDTTTVSEGARVYLYRQGLQGQGVIGSGQVVRASYGAPHWNTARSSDEAHYVDVVFDRLLDPDRDVLMPPTRLDQPPLDRVNWATPTSGIKLDPAAARELDELWAGWADAQSGAERAFLAGLREIHDAGATYRSPFTSETYAVASVDGTRVRVDSLGAEKEVPVTTIGYKQALHAVLAAGGRLPVRDLDATDAVRTTYVQGPSLALSPDGDAVAIPTSRSAADLLVAHAGALLDGKSNQKPYRPALLACVLDAIADGEIAENRVEFDTLLPRFVAKTAAWGHQAGAKQAAYAFCYLSTRPFWLLAYNDRSEVTALGEIETPAAIRRHIDHARLAGPYWNALQDATLRRRVAAAVRAAWDPEPVVDWGLLSRAVDRSIRPLLVGDGLLDPGAGEGYQHHVVLANAGPLLAADAIREDPIAALDGALKTCRNLLSQFQAMKARAFVAHADPDDLRDRTLDLLYGDGALAARVDRFVEWGRADPLPDGKERRLDGTVASYLLAMSAPARYAFCKPTVYAAAADALLGETPAFDTEGARVDHCTRFYRALLPVFRNDHGLPFSDLLHVHIALYTVNAYDTVPGWDDLAPLPRVVKVAPGHEADRWTECRDGGYICVGWDDVGDLRQYDDYDAFAEAFAETNPYDGNASAQTKKGRELWTFRELRPGDRVVANRGIREVLAVGTVVAPGYEWRPGRKSYKHTVAVEWDEGYAKIIPQQKYWAFVTVCELDAELAALILDDAPSSDPDLDGLADVLDHSVGRLLLRRKNVVLYGPPGTGKTRASLGLAEAWERWQGTGSVEQVTFHPTFAYEDFVEGFRPDEETGQFVLRPGLFVELCDRARAERDREFLLLVDELNRGDVARILGELVTLLEPDKRTPHAKRRLPYSHDPFWVPPNVHLLGTMNTADRSVSLLDVAVRRRFAFVETPPDPGVLDRAPIAEVGGVRLSELLRGLNARLARAGVDRDRAIGHSVLLLGPDHQAHSPSVNHTLFPDSHDTGSYGPLEALAERLRYDVIPLVEEYAYAERSLVAGVLGALVDGAGRADEATFADPVRLLDAVRTIAADGRA